MSKNSDSKSIAELQATVQSAVSQLVTDVLQQIDQTNQRSSSGSTLTPRSRHRQDIDSRDDEDFAEPPILKKKVGIHI